MSFCKKAILHLSDMHICDNPHKKEPSLMQNPLYLEELANNIRESLKEEEADLVSLIITGDISDIAHKNDFVSAMSIIKSFCEEFNLSLNHVMIIPGNHDIYWRNIRDDIEKQYESGIQPCEPHLCSSKYDTFKEFYNDFFSTDSRKFSGNSAIVDFMEIPDLNMAFLGVNTNYKESDVCHAGYVEIDTFLKDIKKVKDRIKDKFVIAAFHHLPPNLGSREKTIENWQEVVRCLLPNGIHTCLFGHAHTPTSMQAGQRDDLRLFVGGSIGRNEKGNNSYNLIVIDPETTLLQVDNYQNIHATDISLPHWAYLAKNRNFMKPFYMFDNATSSNELKNITPPVACNLIEEDIAADSGDIAQMRVSENEEEGVSVGAEKESEHCGGAREEEGIETEEKTEGDVGAHPLKRIEAFLLKMIKDNNLFISGHYHWSERDRTHAYVDTNFLLGKYDGFYEILNGLWALYSEENLFSDLIVGYGMLGNVVGTTFASDMECLYSYIPHLGRNHSYYEKTFPSEPPDHPIKNVTIIFDVVFSGENLQKFAEFAKKEFGSLERINAIALLYTGEDEYKAEMFNKQEAVDIYFYKLCYLRMPKCLYADIRQCDIYQHKLETVNVFYEEGKQ